MMQYPITFPNDGHDRWHFYMNIDNRKVTLTKYISYYLMVCYTVPLGPVHCLNKLSQQWIVDQYCNIELGRLTILKHNQKALWADLYTGLVDSKVQDDLELGRLTILKHNQKALWADLYTGLVDSKVQDDLEQTGHLIILLPGYTFGPWYMHQQYQEAMVLVWKYGMPTLFIIMTADTYWPKVLRELKPGQIPQDQPDILCRVFNLRKKQLLLDIEERLFGPIKA